MRTVLIGIATLCLLNSIVKTDEITSNIYKVLYLAEITTEGTATPETNPLSDKLIDELGFNILTPSGYRMHFTLGQQLRENYKDFFSRRVDPHEIKVFSANTEPAQASCRAHIMGLFPLLKHSTITGGISDGIMPSFDGVTTTVESNRSIPHIAKPFPIKADSVREDFDFLVDLYATCPKASKHLGTDTPELMSRLSQSTSGFVDELNSKGISSSKMFGDKHWNPENLAKLYDLAHYYKHTTGQELEGVSSDLYNSISNVKALSLMAKFFPTQKEASLHTHVIASRILRDISTTTFDSDTKARYSLFSGTAKTILSFLVSLRITNFDCLLSEISSSEQISNCPGMPEFASSISFELSENQNKDKFLRVLYNGGAIRFSKYGNNSYDRYHYDYELLKNDIVNKCISDEYDQFCGYSMIDQDKIHWMKLFSNAMEIFKFYLLFINFGIIVFLLVIAFITFCLSQGRYKHMEITRGSDVIDSGYKANQSLVTETEMAAHLPSGGIMTTERAVTEEDSYTEEPSNKKKAVNIKKHFPTSKGNLEDSPSKTKNLDLQVMESDQNDRTLSDDLDEEDEEKETKGMDRVK